MGSPVSAVITNLYMKDFEEQALSFAPTAPKITLCWRHFYHLKTKWCRKSSTAASQHSTTSHPFYNGDWEWQHNSLFWHIGHKRFRRTPRYKCLQKTYAHISVPYGSLLQWLTPMTLNQLNAVLSSAYTLDWKISSLNHRLSLRKRSI